MIPGRTVRGLTTSKRPKTNLRKGLSWEWESSLISKGRTIGDDNLSERDREKLRIYFQVRDEGPLAVLVRLEGIRYCREFH